MRKRILDPTGDPRHQFQGLLIVSTRAPVKEIGPDPLSPRGLALPVRLRHLVPVADAGRGDDPAGR